MRNHAGIPEAALIVLLRFQLQLSSTFAQGTAFTYQGRPSSGAGNYTGNAEFQPTLWDSAAGGNAAAANSPASVITGVTNGEAGKTLEPQKERP